MNVIKFAELRSRGFLVGAILWFSVFLFYLRSLAPTLLWGDSAKLAISSRILDLHYTPGNHPLHALIGWVFNLIPVGNIAFRQNLMSAVFGSLTIFILYYVVLKITNSKLSSVCAALSLAVSHIFWHLSVINETYTLLAFFFTLLILILLLWQRDYNNRLLYTFFFLLGLSISNSSLMVLFIPAYLIYFIFPKKNRKAFINSNIFFIIVSFLLGLIILISLFIHKHWINSEVFSYSEAVPMARYYRSLSKMLKEFIRYPAYLFYQFPLFGFLIGLKGVKRMFESDIKIFGLLAVITVINLCFAGGYMRQKQFYLLMPTYVMFSILIGIGFNSLRGKYNKRAILIFIVCLPIVTYHSVPMVANNRGIDLVKARSLPYRDNNRFFLLPDKSNYFGAYRFGNEVFEVVSPGSIIIADFTPRAALDYFQIIENVGRQVKVVFNESINVPEFIADNIDKQKIYLADLEPYYHTDYLKEKYNIVPRGPIFQVIKR
jgi:Protein O-mannosyl-transferase TMEM260-like